jgi:hypothetical protein
LRGRDADVDSAGNNGKQRHSQDRQVVIFDGQNLEV